MDNGSSLSLYSQSSIDGNTAEQGGGVYSGTDCSINLMSTSSITNNSLISTDITKGAGVYCQTTDALFQDDGFIYNNYTSDNQQSNAYYLNNTIFTEFPGAYLNGMWEATDDDASPRYYFFNYDLYYICTSEGSPITEYICTEPKDLTFNNGDSSSGSFDLNWDTYSYTITENGSIVLTLVDPLSIQTVFTFVPDKVPTYK